MCGQTPASEAAVVFVHHFSLFGVILLISGLYCYVVFVTGLFSLVLLLIQRLYYYYYYYYYYACCQLYAGYLQLYA